MIIIIFALVQLLIDVHEKHKVMHHFVAFSELKGHRNGLCVINTLEIDELKIMHSLS